MKTIVIIQDDHIEEHRLTDLITEHCSVGKVISSYNNLSEGFEMVNLIRPDILFIAHTDYANTKLRLTHEPNHLFLLSDIAICCEKSISYIQKPFLIGSVIPLLNSVCYRLDEKEQDKIAYLSTSEKSKRSSITLNTNEGLMLLNYGEIIQVNAERAYSSINLINGKEILISKSMKKIESLLSNDMFFKPHRSHLINTQHLKGYIKADGGSAIMQNGLKVPVSRRKKSEFLSLLKNGCRVLK